MPWKWGGLRRWEREVQPVDGFRREMVSVNRDFDRLDDKDVEVSLTERTLTIRGEKWDEKESKESDFYRECAYGRFRRSIEIPADVDAEKIEASFSKGVLTVQLPRTKEAQRKVRQIAVKAA